MTSTNQDSGAGFAFAIGAYLLWGLLPFYMKAMAHIPAAEVVAHRVIWAIPVAGLVLLVTGRFTDLLVALKTPRMLAMAALTAVLIAVNWGIYVWSIANDNALETALGYYINPLFSIFLGALILGERLTRLQWTAVALAALAVIVLTVEAGQLPLAALGLTFSWGFYAFFKKSLPIGPNQGFMLEVLVLSPLALGFVAYLSLQGGSHFLTGPTWDTALLLGCGVVTATPLILFANGAKLLRLSTIGILQYIAPSMIFLIAVFAFGEEFGRGEMIAFPMIWTSLVLYSISLIRQARKRSRVDAAVSRNQ